jgi:hypothetical protein
MSAVFKQKQPKRVIYRRIESSPDIEELFLAMKFGHHQRALELLRVYLMNTTGRILP